MSKITFQGTSVFLDGQRVQLTGYGSRGAAYQSSDYPSFMHDLVANRCNLNHQWVCPLPFDYQAAPNLPPTQPMVKVGAKYDFGHLNPEFWQRFDSFARLAAQSGIVLIVTIWDECQIREDMKRSPLNVNNGGFLAPDNAVARFYDEAHPEIERFTKAVLSHLEGLGLWNLIIEPINEPGAGGSAARANKFHDAFYAWMTQVGATFPVMPNLVVSGPAEAVWPDPARAAVKLVSFHGPIWARCTALETKKAIAHLIQKTNRPAIVDTDACRSPQLSRDDNVLVLDWAVGALQAGAAGINHLDDEPVGPSSNYDYMALDALRSARDVVAHGDPAVDPILGDASRSAQEIPDTSDLTADPAHPGAAHLAWFWADAPHGMPAALELRYAPRDGGAVNLGPLAEANATDMNWPRVAVVGNETYVFYGGRSHPANGLWFRRRVGAGAFEAPVHMAADRQVEFFDAIGWNGGVEVVLSAIVGGRNQLFRYTLKSGVAGPAQLLYDAPEAHPHLAVTADKVYFACYFRTIRYGFYDAGGHVQMATLTDIHGDSAGETRIGVTPNGVVHLTWVAWRKLYGSHSFPAGVFAWDDQSKLVKQVDAALPLAKRVTSARPDLWVDVAGAPYVTYDVSGYVYLARRESGNWVSRKVAVGAEPHVFFWRSAGTRNIELSFAGPVPGNLSLVREKPDPIDHNP